MKNIWWNHSEKLGDSESKHTTHGTPDHVPYSNIVNLDSAQLPYDNDTVTPNCTSVFDKATTDQYIHAELNLPQGGGASAESKIC